MKGFASVVLNSEASSHGGVHIQGPPDFWKLQNRDLKGGMVAQAVSTSHVLFRLQHHIGVVLDSRSTFEVLL